MSVFSITYAPILGSSWKLEEIYDFKRGEEILSKCRPFFYSRHEKRFTIISSADCHDYLRITSMTISKSTLLHPVKPYCFSNSAPLPLVKKKNRIFFREKTAMRFSYQATYIFLCSGTGSFLLNKRGLW